MRSSEAAARVTAFTGRLAAVRERGRDAADVAAAESKRLLAELNDTAERETARLPAQLHAQISGLFHGELAIATPAEIQRRGRERLSQLTIAAAELWRQAQQDRLVGGLRRLGARLTRRLWGGIR